MAKKRKRNKVVGIVSTDQGLARNWVYDDGYLFPMKAAPLKHTVPVDPTDAMIMAGLRAVERVGNGTTIQMVAAYKAMIAAAPRE